MLAARINRLITRDFDRFGCLSWWLLFRCLPTLILMLVSLLLLSATKASAGSERDEVESGQLLLQDGNGSPVHALVHQSRAEINVSGMLATVSLEQTFSNSSETWVEGVYVFPLPADAAVRHLEMQVGERRIIGKIRERKEARNIYKKAKAAGKKASLVEQQRPNLFTNRVANIGPGESVTVSLEYVQPVRYAKGQFSLRLPTTLTARYIPGIHALPEQEAGAHAILPGLGWGMPTDQVVDADLITPPQYAAPGRDHQPLNPIEIVVRLDMGMPLAEVLSPYHEIALSRRAGVYDIKLAQGVAEMDRDFLLQWTPVTGSAPSAAFFTERVDGEYYGLLMLVPPALERAPETPPREIVFVVDTSGSMGGEPIRQARQSLDSALQHLRPEDSFNIIQFNSTHHSLFRSALPANRHNLQLAAEYVRHLQATGGTEMMPALQAALSRSAVDDELNSQPGLRQVIFVTDGAVGNEAALFEEIVRILGPSRLFTVGIGSAPNGWFMRQAAAYGRGTYTHIGDLSEVSATMDDLFSLLSAPVATDLRVGWPMGAEAWPQRLPDLYQGEPLLVAVKLGTKLPDADLLVSGRMGQRDWDSTLRFFDGADPGDAIDSPGVASLWARKKIAGLLDSKLRGKEESWVRSQVLPLALQHSLLSPYTSFVAVEEKPSRPNGFVLKNRSLPNTRPQGQSPQPFAYPNTATTAAANIWLGSLFLLLALFARAFREGADHD